MNRGYAKLWRKSIDSMVWSGTHEQWRVWCWCLMKANHKDGYFLGQQVKRGEFITGRTSGSLECQMPPSTWYRAMQQLQEWSMVGLKVNNKWTTVSICNYSIYNDIPEESEQQADSKRTADEQQVDTNKNDNNSNHSKHSKKQSNDRDYSTDFIAFWEHYPKVGRVKKPDAWRAWQKAIKRIEPSKIIEAVKKYSMSDTGLSQYAGHASTWLNGDRWTEDCLTWQRDLFGGSKTATTTVLREEKFY